MRLLLSTLVGTAALAGAGAGAAGPAAVESRACALRDVSVNIQILGDRSHGWRLGGYTAIPARTTTIAVWSNGGPPATDGLLAYAWLTRTRSTFSALCTSGRPFRQVSGGLGSPVRVKDRWFFGRKFNCIVSGRVVTEIRDVTGGKRITVRVQRTGKLLAVGEVKAGGGWLRGSTSCRDSDR